MPLTHFFLIIIVVVVWGFNFVVIRLGLEGIPPILLVAIRFFLTSIPFIFFVKRPQVRIKWIILYGLIMFALQFTLLFIGMNIGITPGIASLLLQVQVFFTILLAVLFLGEKPHLWQILGGIIACTGIGIVLINIGSHLTLRGFIFVIGAALSFGIGNCISKKIGCVNMFSMVIWGSLFAWPPLLVLSLGMEGYEKIISTLRNLGWLSFGAITYIAYLSTLFAFWAWSWLLYRHPLSTIAPFGILVPILAVFSSVWILGEALEEWKIIAALIVISGLCLNMLGPRLFGRKR